MTTSSIRFRSIGEVAMLGPAIEKPRGCSSCTRRQRDEWRLRYGSILRRWRCGYVSNRQRITRRERGFYMGTIDRLFDVWRGVNPLRGRGVPATDADRAREQGIPSAQTPMATAGARDRLKTES